MHILKSNVYEVVIAACKETHFNDEFTGCSKAEIVAYFRLLDHRQESVLDIDVVIEHIEHFQHRISRYSFLLDFIRYHVKSIALDNAIHANNQPTNKSESMSDYERAKQGDYHEQQPRHQPEQKVSQAKPPAQPTSNQPRTVQQNYVERPAVAPVNQTPRPQPVSVQANNYANNTHTSIDDETNSVSYDEAMFEQPVANVDQSEQPIYGAMSDTEDYGVESDAHHMDMGYREDDDLY